MSGRNEHPDSLAEPPIARLNPQAVEVLRVWAAPGKPRVITFRTTWQDAGTWGLVLADVAKFASKASAQEGRGPKAVLVGMRERFNAELTSLTENRKGITDANGSA